MLAFFVGRCTLILCKKEEGTMKAKVNMTEGSLWDKILKFALPLAMSGILQQLFNAADVAVVGQFSGKEAMAAVGANSPVVNIMITLFTGIALGANVVISRYTGRRDRESSEKAAHTSILVALISGLCILVAGQFFATTILSLMKVPQDCFDLAVLYLRIYLLGMPVILLYNFESAIFQSQGDTRTPLIVLTSSGILNVILNLCFVLGLGMSVDGVSTATVLSNLFSSVILFVLLLKGRTPLKIEKQRFHMDGKILKEMLKIGVPAGIQGMVFSISNILIQTAVNSLGTDVVAGSSAGMNIEILGYFVVNSFSQTCTTFIGQNYGAQKTDRCHKTLALCLLESVIFGGGISVLLMIFARPLLHFFNSDPQVIEYGRQRVVGILSFEVLNGAIDIISGAMRGYGESMVPAIITLIGICGVRIIWLYTYFAAHPSFKTLIMAYPVSWIITLIVMVAVYLYMKEHGLGKTETVPLQEFKKGE